MIKDCDLKYFFAFSLCPTIGAATFRRIKKAFPSFEKAWEELDGRLSQKAQIENKHLEVLRKIKAKNNLNQLFAQLIKDKIQIITEEEPTYPPQLREIKSAPFALFCYGNDKLLGKKQLAVVGTRMFTSYGQMVTEKLVSDLANAGLVITSGLAQGIDSAAHKATLSVEGKTIAVLGGGINEYLQKGYSHHLIKEIIKKDGLIVSEYPPDFHATKFTFPARNRIISGLSLGTLVIEADDRSGSLITANCALDQNRDVFAVPGNIFSAKSIGTHRLIKQGAKLISCANDVLEAFNFATVETAGTSEEVEFQDEEERKIYEKLSLDPLHVDKVAKATGLSSVTASAKLSMLELRGLARNVGGGRFIRN